MLLSILFSLSTPKVLASPDTETLRPNGPGTTTELERWGDDANWKCVDDPGAHDGYMTFV